MVQIINWFWITNVDSDQWGSNNTFLYPKYLSRYTGFLLSSCMGTCKFQICTWIFMKHSMNIMLVKATTSLHFLIPYYQ